MLKLSKGRRGTLFVLRKDLEKAEKYKKSYGFDKVEIKKLFLKNV